MRHSGNDRVVEILDELLDDVLARKVSRAIACARACQRWHELAEDDGLTKSERDRRDTEAALIEMRELGDGRGAAAKVAARRASDPHEQEMLAQRYRRARRRKLNEPGSFAGANRE